ncbi:MAG: membrane protease YdiL (CAAX protease family) [Patiriisocius sp.]|jgi:membrane protease YdiL (CAAX protease family)
MPHTKGEKPVDLFITGYGNNGIWNIPYSFLFLFLIAGLWCIGQLIGFVGAVYLNPELSGFFADVLSGNPERIEALAFNGEVVWPTALVGGIFGISAVFLCVRFKKGSKIKDYLALNIPDIKQVLLWIGIMILFLFSFEYAAKFFPDLESDFMQKVMESTTKPVMLLISIGIIAPIFEELIFRGFLYKGLEQSRLGPHAAVWITSILFAIIHTQYSLSIVILIIPMALVMGYSRMYTKSIWTPILLHIFNNSLTTIIALSELEVI